METTPSLTNGARPHAVGSSTRPPPVQALGTRDRGPDHKSVLLLLATRKRHLVLEMKHAYIVIELQDATHKAKIEIISLPGGEQ